MTACVFCEIASGDREALVVGTAPETIAFLDHRPLFPGHVLVIPRSHHETVEDLPADAVEPVFAHARRVATAVREALDAEGTFIAMNNTVSQSVPHLHIHVVPRRRGDGLRGFFWPRVGYDDEAHAEQVRAAVAALLA